MNDNKNAGNHSSRHPLKIGMDGGARPNPGPTSWAWIDENGEWHAGWFRHATNNVGELTALARLLEDHASEDIDIIYDSKYAINTVTKWGPDWVRKGPPALRGKANLDIILPAIELYEARARAGLSTVLTWRHGHRGDRLNELADSLCTMTLDSHRKNLRDAMAPDECEHRGHLGL